MKKFLVILLAAVICATAAYSVVAVENDEAEQPTAAAEDQDTAIEEVVEKLKDDNTAADIAGKINDALENGAAEEDILSLVDTFGTYVSDRSGVDISALKSAAARRDLLSKFLVDAGVDPDKLSEAISSAQDAFSSSSSSSYSDGSDADYSSSTVTTGTEDSASYSEMVEAITIPDTDFRG
ncbi:MAG: hypothetical protein IJT03_06905 [Clostridia bacterium]|nr:hypothetical protein [Clostridia bacterium]